MRKPILCLLPLFVLAAYAWAQSAAPARSTPTATVLVVVGAPGEEEFGKVFEESADRWKAAADKAGARYLAIGRDAPGAIPDHDLLKAALEAEPVEGRGELWIVLLGHGSFDGSKEARFALRGPDVTSEEMAQWLKPMKRPVAVIDTSSASAPFINALKGPERVVITATRSGSEQNYTRFGRAISESVADPASDLDKDGETSLLEAFLSAASRTAEFYKTEGRLATEHPLIDDNGDGMGTPPDWFRGVRAAKKADKGVAADGPRALQFALVHSAAELQLSPERRAERDSIERLIGALKDRKESMPAEQYYAQLERHFQRLSEIYAGQ